MGAFRMPKVLLRILACYLTSVGDECGDVREVIAVLLDNSSRDDAYSQLFCECTIGVEVLLILGTERDEAGIFGEPV